MISRRDTLRLGAGLPIALAAARGASAQGKMVFKASDVHPEGYPTVAAVELSESSITLVTA